MSDTKTSCSELIAVIDAFLNSAKRLPAAMLEFDKKRAEIIQRRKDERQSIVSSGNAVLKQRFDNEDIAIMIANSGVNKKLREIKNINITRNGIYGVSDEPLQDVGNLEKAAAAYISVLDKMAVAHQSQLEAWKKYKLAENEYQEKDKQWCAVAEQGDAAQKVFDRVDEQIRQSMRNEELSIIGMADAQRKTAVAAYMEEKLRVAAIRLKVSKKEHELPY